MHPDPLAIVHHAGTLLNAGDVGAAIAALLELIESPKFEDPSVLAPAEAYQKLGICYRMQGDRLDEDSPQRIKYYASADEAFQTALDRAVNDIHRGQILRDWSMVALGRHNHGKALEQLEQSVRLLEYYDADDLNAQSNISPEENKYRRGEYWTSVGFMGRVYTGRKAFELLKRADKELRGILPNELNNLVSAFKVAGIFYRLCHVPRALWLVRQVAMKDKRKMNKARIAQIILLIFCRPLATRWGG